MTTTSELFQILFCILAFVGFLRVFRFLRLFSIGVIHGYRAYRFQAQTRIETKIEQINFVAKVNQTESNIEKFENDAITAVDKTPLLEIPYLPVKKHFTTVH